MAGRLPSFASGSNLAINIDGIQVAYGANLTFTDDVAHAPVGGIGSFSYDSIEPLQYLARGAFTITRYSALSIVQNAKNLSLPERMRAATQATTELRDGNSFLTSNSFNPLALLLSKTFDIVVYERQSTADATSQSLKAVFRIEDCRLTDYGLSFTPGSMVAENIGFMAIRLIDLVSANASEAAALTGSQQSVAGG